MFELFPVLGIIWVPFIIAAAIAAAAAAGSAAIRQGAMRKAANKQKDAIAKLKGNDLEASKTMVADQDKAYYLQSKAFFREQDPELAAARDAAVKRINDEMQAPYKADAVLDQKIKENLQPDAQAEEIRNTLMQRAKEDLALGATLPPEYQAEMVRAGLENASGTGVGANRLGPVTARTGTLLGAAGLDIKARREKAASDLLGADSALKASRANLLGNLLSEAAQLSAQKFSLEAGVSNLAAQNTQSVGMKGADLLQLQLANENFERSKTMSLAQLEAMKVMSNAEAQSAYVQAAGKFGETVAGGASGAPTTGAPAAGAKAPAMAGNTSIPSAWSSQWQPVNRAV